MRIPLTVREVAGVLRPVVVFSYQIPSIRMRGRIEALIDTGSPYTLFSEAEGIRQQFPYSRRQHDTSIGISSINAWKYPVNEVQLAFLTAEGQVVRFTTNGFFLKSTSDKQDVRGQSACLPNILGMDFIFNNNLGFWMKGKSGFLTDEDVL
ncbi:MAG: hypothetical protein HY520_01040 [Candidatus Aenigmarchaeota archaeon]|nr:hypothetical protein [Candidatus Aenigmarchaeota archaeon]